MAYPETLFCAHRAMMDEAASIEPGPFKLLSLIVGEWNRMMRASEFHLRLPDLLSKLNLSRSSFYRFRDRLIADGWLGHDPKTRQYRLGPRWAQSPATAGNPDENSKPDPAQDTPEFPQFRRKSRKASKSQNPRSAPAAADPDAPPPEQSSEEIRTEIWKLENDARRESGQLRKALADRAAALRPILQAALEREKGAPTSSGGSNTKSDLPPLAELQKFWAEEYANCSQTLETIRQAWREAEHIRQNFDLWKSEQTIAA